MPHSCWNLRVSAEADRGGRKYMEDVALVDFRREQNIEYAVFGIFDGHGGRQAARFAKAHLMSFIRQQKCFWSSRPENVKRAIHEGFIACHEAMRRKLPEWPKTMLGHPCTAGTTASIAIIRGNMLYVAYVGDSGIVMGFEKTGQDESKQDEIEQQPINQNNGSLNFTIPTITTFSGQKSEGPAYSSAATLKTQTGKYFYRELTTDHKPESIIEKRRIETAGGAVAIKNGVHRVIWNRPKLQNGVATDQHDRIPFLAVARSMGDLWSYCPSTNEFAVSPIPDIEVYDLTAKNEKAKFIIVASDGIWNMIRPWDSVHLVSTFQERKKNGRTEGSPAHDIVREALGRWRLRGLRADNSTAVVIWLDRAPGSTSKTFVNRAWSSDNPIRHQINSIKAVNKEEKEEKESEPVKANVTVSKINDSGISNLSNQSNTKLTDMTHQVPPNIDIEDEDSSEVTLDLTIQSNDIEPAKYPSAKRMKAFADLTIPTSQLLNISDDESDDDDQVNLNVSEHSKGETTQSEDQNINENVNKSEDVSKVLSEYENDLPTSNKGSEDEYEQDSFKEKGSDSESHPSLSKRHKSSIEESDQKPVKTSKVVQDISSDDVNMPEISITTQTRNTATSIITTTTTTIVTRKRSSSESNNSKLGNSVSSENPDQTNAAKKRKKSDPQISSPSSNYNQGISSISEDGNENVSDIVEMPSTSTPGLNRRSRRVVVKGKCVTPDKNSS